MSPTGTPRYAVDELATDRLTVAGHDHDDDHDDGRDDQNRADQRRDDQRRDDTPVEAASGRHRHRSTGPSASALWVAAVRSTPLLRSASTLPWGPALRTARTVTPLVLVGLMLAACTSASTPPAPPTARVERADVTTAVFSTGSLSATTEQNLGFLRGGQITAVNVVPGQQVKAGQVLATIDDYFFRRTLEEQQATLAQEQADLTLIVNGRDVPNAQRTFNQAGDILSSTQNQRQEIVNGDDDLVDRAEKGLDLQQDLLDQAEERLSNDRKACGGDADEFLNGGATSTSGSSGSSASSGGSAANQAQINALVAQLTNGQDLSDAERARLEAAIQAAGGLVSSIIPPATSASPQDQACGRLQSDQSTVNNSRTQVEAARNTLDQARARRDADRATQQTNEENARQSRITAQNNLDTARTDRPSRIAAQRALVANAQAAVNSAQRDVDDTVLRAPIDSTVSVVNGTVGEFVPASGATGTALAPGGGAAIPGTGSTSSGTSGVNGGSTTVTAPGGNQFITLDNLSRFQVVVPFEESDAVRISPNQRVNVTFDALPEVTQPGIVTQVAPSSTALSGVISYYVSVLLTGNDPRLRNGQTAQAGVLTQDLRDVLTVPNGAIRQQGGQSVVTVLGFNGPRVVPFQPGAVGDDRTQVLSGLTPGDEVLLSGR